MLSEDQMTELKAAQEQATAIHRLEGLEPTETTQGIDYAILAGRVTHEQAASELRSYVMEHKTVDGFIKSRTWA